MGEPHELVALLKTPTTDINGRNKNEISLLSTYKVSNVVSAIGQTEIPTCL